MPNLNMRIPQDLHASIETNAQRAGLTITAYVLQWLPDAHQRTTQDTGDTTPENRRGARAA